MNIEVRLFIQFKDYLPLDARDGKAIVALPDGARVVDLYEQLGLPVEEQKIVVLNGVSQGTSPEINTYILKEGDIIAVFPPLGGG